MESKNFILQENRVTISVILLCQEISSLKLSKNPTRMRSDCTDSRKFGRGTVKEVVPDMSSLFT